MQPLQQLTFRKKYREHFLKDGAPIPACMARGTKEFVGPALWDEQPVAQHASLVADDSVQRMTGIVQNGQQFEFFSLLLLPESSSMPTTEPALLISFFSLDRSALDMLPPQYTTA